MGAKRPGFLLQSPPLIDYCPDDPVRQAHTSQREPGRVLPGACSDCRHAKVHIHRAAPRDNTSGSDRVQSLTKTDKTDSILVTSRVPSPPNRRAEAAVSRIDDRATDESSGQLSDAARLPIVFPKQTAIATCRGVAAHKRVGEAGIRTETRCSSK
jgi:hypothetical protein